MIKKNTYLHCIVKQLMFELFDGENLLEEVVELLLRHDLVAQHGCGRSLAWPSCVLVWNKDRSTTECVTDLDSRHEDDYF